MACPCSKKRRPMVGRPVRAAGDDRRRSVTASAATAATTGSWGTTCGEETYRSLIRAQAAARDCGGRVRPA